MPRKPEIDTDMGEDLSDFWKEERRSGVGYRMDEVMDKLRDAGEADKADKLLSALNNYKITPPMIMRTLEKWGSALNLHITCSTEAVRKWRVRHPVC